MEAAALLHTRSRRQIANWKLGGLLQPSWVRYRVNMYQDVKVVPDRSRKVIGNNHGSCIDIVPNDTEMAWINRPSTTVGDLVGTQSKHFLVLYDQMMKSIIVLCNVLMLDVIQNEQPDFVRHE